MPAEPVSAGQDRPRRPARPLLFLEVLRREQLSPHMVRIVAGGPNFHRFEPKDCTDSYCKIWFGPDGRPVPEGTDLEQMRLDTPRERWPVSRTYTVRWVDTAAAELAIDFVIHGDEGIAGPWAASARPGETLSFTGPGGAFSLDPEADWYFFAADESALPATAAALEALPAGAVGHAYFEVQDPSERQPLAAPEGVRLHWLYRSEDPAPNLLARAVAQAPWLPGSVQVFAHGEREAMKALRDTFFTHRGLDRSRVSLSGYWAAGRTEDAFQAEKRTPIGKIL